MKIFKFILNIITILIITAILIIFCQREDEMKIAGMNKIIEIKSWDTKYDKSKLLDTIQTFAEKNKISIYKTTTKTINHKTVKEVYNFNNKVEQQRLSTFNKKVDIKYISRKEVEGQDLKGQYFFDGDKLLEKEFVNTLTSVNVKSEVYRLNVVMIFLESIFDKGLFIPLTSVILVYLLYYIQLHSTRFKEFALKQLNGYSYFNLINESVRKASKYWLVLFTASYMMTLAYLFITDNYGALMLFSIRLIGAYLVIYGIDLVSMLISFTLLALIDVPQMVKGKKPYITLRLINVFVKFTMVLSVAILLVQSEISIKSIKKMNEVSHIWSKMNDYYILELAPIVLDKKESDALDKKFYQFSIKQEKQGALLLKNNSIYHPNRNDYSSVDNSNYMIVNDNFIKFYHQIDKSIKIEPSHSTIQVMIPRNNKKDNLNIKRKVEEWSKFQTSLGAKYYKVKVSDFKDYHKLYSFDLRNEAKFKYLSQPALIIVNGDQVSPNFYSATISQGFFLFKNLEQIQKDLNAYGLDNYVSGITNYTDQVQMDMHDIRFQLIITVLTIIVSILIIF